MPMEMMQQDRKGRLGGAVIGTTLGVGATNAMRDLLKEKDLPEGRKLTKVVNYFKNKPVRKAILGGAIGSVGFLGGMAAGSKYDKLKQHYDNKANQWKK